MQEGNNIKVRIGRFTAFGLIPIILLIITYSSCKKENLRYTARITLLNAVPDASALEVFAAGKKLNATTSYGLPDYYIEVPAVTDTIKWRVNGQSNFDSVFVADLPNNTDFTLLFFDSARRLSSYMIKDDWQGEPSDRQGYIRFFPLTVNANAVQITNDTGKVLISGRGFADFRSRAGDFVAIDTFTTSLKLVNNNIVLDSLPGAKIFPGKSYTLYSVGVLNATGDKRPRLILQEHHE